MVEVLSAEEAAQMSEQVMCILSQLDQMEIIGAARDGLEAIDSIRKLNPEVVILDIRMPRSSGLKVLESIKKDALHPIVLVLNNYPYPQYRKKFIEAGAHYFFDKSTEFDKIPEVLERLVLMSNT